MFRRNRSRHHVTSWILSCALIASALLTAITAWRGPGGLPPTDERGDAGDVPFAITGSHPRPESLLDVVGPTLTGLVDQPATAAAVPRNPWRIPRGTSDRPDRKQGHQIHVVYLVPSDRKGQALDRKGVLDDSVRSLTRWMRRESGYKWRFDTFGFQPAGSDEPVAAVDVTFVRGERPAHEVDTVTAIWRELERSGLPEPDKRYLVYAATPSEGHYCGQSFFPRTQDPGDVGFAAVVFLDGPAGCRARSFAPNRRSPSWAESIAVHELLHNEGAVQRTAPHDCRSVISTHVCTPNLVLRVGADPEERDVLFTYVVAGLSGLVLDLGRDDYFDHPHSFRDLIDSPYMVRAARHQ